MRPAKQKIPTQNDVDTSIEEPDDIEAEEEGIIEGADKASKESTKPTGSESAGFMPKLATASAKKTAKLGAIIVGSGIAVYKIFLSNADTPPPSDDSQQAVQAPQPATKQTSKDFAKQEIPLSNKPSGTIAERPKSADDKTNNKDIDINKHNPTILPPQKEIKLDAPELPPLPDLTPQEAQIKVPSIKMPPKNNNNQAKAPDPNVDPNSPEGQQQVAQTFDPQHVTNNGIPIINSADLSLEQKRRLTMFVMNGSGPSSNNSNQPKKEKSDIIVLDGSTLSIEKQQASNVGTQRVVNLETTLLQGKMMDAVLETAINSQLPGNVRGIIINDVYGEMGNKVLVPRGSRIYGSYQSTVTRGQSRLQISWNRLIRPDGISISIQGNAADQFGRIGLEGDVDNRFGDTLANSLLVTLSTLGAAAALNQFAGSSASQSQTINPSGTFTTSNINPLSVAAQGAIQNMQKITDQLTQGSTELQPIVTLPQGTKIKVMVAQDIILPAFQKVDLP